MKPRNTLIAVLLLAALGAYVYFVEIPGEAKKKAAEEAGKKVWDVKDADVQSFTITRPDGALTVTRSGERWNITAPITADGDDFTPGDVARALAELKKEATVDEAPAADGEAKYGLDTPKVKVAWVASGNRSGEIHVGRKNPIGNTHYARVGGQKAVVLIDAFSVTAFDKDLFALRNKKLLDFKEEEVRGIEIHSAGRSTVLAKEGARFWMTSPVRDFGREEAIKTLLGSLRFMEGTRFVEEAPKELTAFGLQDPHARLVLRLGEAAATQSLLVGAKVPGEEGAYVKRGEKPAVAVGPASLLTDLQKGPDDLRENRAMPFERWDAREVEIATGGSGVRLARAEVEAEGGKQQTGDWQVAPIKDGKAGDLVKADWRAVDDALKALGEITATAYLDAAPAGIAFDAPAAVTVKVALHKEEAPRIYTLVVAADGKSAFVRDPSRPVVLQVAPEGRSKLPTDAAPLVEQAAAAPAAAPATISS